MPRLFARALKKCGEERTALILVATSGDTGKAALEGYRDVDGIKIQVFYPIDGVSEVQKKQMQTQEGGNLSVIGIKGNFDDAQSGVKSIFADGDIAARLDDNRVFLSSANSINWGRLVPQIVYYISAYCDMYKSGAISLGESIDVCVPTGNFGNIFACYIAKKMGLPVDKLVCASNKNNILTDFLKSGVYDKNRSFYTTMSPSMDILISSNLERLLYLLLGSERCAELMKQLSECGRYELTKAELEIMNESFVGYFADEKDCINTVKKTYEKEDRLIDTHTSVAVFSAEQYMSENKAKNKMLVVSTASPYKFAGDVLLSLTEGKPENDLDAPEMLFRLTKEEIPLPLKSTLGKKPIHTDVIDKSDMADTVLSFALN
jgi:threonine synthase